MYSLNMLDNSSPFTILFDFSPDSYLNRFHTRRHQLSHESHRSTCFVLQLFLHYLYSFNRFFFFNRLIERSVSVVKSSLHFDTSLQVPVLPGSQSQNLFPYVYLNYLSRPVCPGTTGNVPKLQTETYLIFR